MGVGFSTQHIYTSFFLLVRSCSSSSPSCFFIVLLFVREFCNMVRKIFIFTREEVQKMNPCSLDSNAKEISLASEDGTVPKGVKEFHSPSVTDV